MKKIYIIATDNKTWIAKFFRIAVKEKFVHISIALDKKCKRVYSFGRKKAKWPLPAGFINEDFEAISKNYHGSLCRVYELEITNAQYYKLKNDLRNNYMKDAIKYRYNIRGLPFLGINFVYHRKYHYVCSQFCGKILIDSGIIDFKKDYSVIKPQDFFQLPNIKLIFEGKTVDYLRTI